jgi:hypothetical protein
MRTRTPIKTDLIIGMTLAEIFLLILFVVWYSHGAGAGPEWERIAKERQTEINKLKNDLQEQKDKVLELERISEWWRKNFGVNPPASTSELEDALRTPQGQTVRQDLARDLPRCDQDNILVEASVIHGTTEVRVRDEVRLIQNSLHSSETKLPAAGEVLRTQQGIHAFLESVSGFYAYSKKTSKACRFDYKLKYATKEDYFDGRETFEKYFYPAGITTPHMSQ